MADEETMINQVKFIVMNDSDVAEYRDFGSQEDAEGWIKLHNGGEDPGKAMFVYELRRVYKMETVPVLVETE